jgi:hypothetical protein
MKKVASVLLALGCLAVAGCQSTKSNYDPDKPIDKMTPTELCHYYTVFLSNPDLTPDIRKIATQKQHDKGCTPG